MMNYSKAIGLKICDWYAENKRDLPWRNTSDPYKIWISEVILQQTRVNQGLEYYNRFVAKFPDVFSLAGASLDEVLKCWQGLGYYSRARNLHVAAQMVVNVNNGKFPLTFSELIILRGVGPYTAAAVASIANNEAVPVVDGNVFRVLSRYTGTFNVANGSSYKLFADLSLTFMDTSRPGIYNQAVMELGASICSPVQPQCSQCPLVRSCYAYKNDKIHDLPVKVVKPKPRNRYFNYLVYFSNHYICLKQRPAGDIWEALYDFPLVETASKVSISKLNRLLPAMGFGVLGESDIVSRTEYDIHKLTHQHIYASFICVKCDDHARLPEGGIWVANTELENFAVPRLIEKFMLSEFVKLK